MKYLNKSWIRKSSLFILSMILVSPLFAWAANAVDYSEPLENAAHQIGAIGEGYSLFSGIFPEYSLPGTNIVLDTAVAGFFGVLVTFGLAWSIGRIIKKGNE
ncbi:metal transporter [archaeon SCG-AAA382B04]|nr:metal transporter [archaeon SCG-AAA382B04]